MIAELHQIIPKIANRFDWSPDCLNVVPIKHGGVERNNIWRVIVDGQSHLLKQHYITRPVGDSASTPFEVESSVLSKLREAGCSVPKVVWQSDPDLCLLLEWCGESTLDDAAQTAPSGSLKETITGALGEFCHLEKSFAAHHADFAPYVYPLDYPTHLRQTMDDMLDRGRQTLDYLARSSGEPSPLELEKLWSNFAQAIRSNSATLGVLDYNARNIVLSAGNITFVDFGSIGWDWSERRIVQFFNSLGANREGGNFVNLLNRDVIRAYASRAISYRSGCSEEGIFAQLDYQNILFYLSIVHRLLATATQPNRKENRVLLKAWGDTEARLTRALEILVNCELSDDSTAGQIREYARRYWDGATTM
ncbi:MAG: phosphotransferase [Candidatus Poribacteria bacterium]|nr:phosphotransferase [Candidatus Poribacteria bacterium]